MSRPGTLTVYRWELRKLRAQKRTYLGLGAAALVPIVFVVSRTKERITINPPAGLFDLNTDTDADADEGEK